MRQHRLYVDSPPVVGTELLVGPESARYLGKALRMRIGESLQIFDGSGGFYLAEILSIERRSARLRVTSFHDEDVESPIQLTLLQAVSRGERMDFVIQKATELGVTQIQPVLSEFGGVRLDAQRSASRLAHWTGIARNACQQCGRNRVPDIAEPQGFGMALKNLPAVDLALLLDPGARAHNIDVAPRHVALAIGPEGGFSEAEINLAREHGFKALRLGPRILRTETAALAAISVLQAKFGDFGA
ncbi:MAG: 16S rRNA (uracil(1498)-N(3))-methyltransferase [Pseudomonadota bacterium]